jgi:hypothetical protein
MVLQGLTPRVQDAKEASLGSEMLGVTCHLEHGFGAGLVDQVLILQFSGCFRFQLCSW